MPRSLRLDHHGSRAAIGLIDDAHDLGTDPPVAIGGLLVAQAGRVQNHSCRQSSLRREGNGRRGAGAHRLRCQHRWPCGRRTRDPCAVGEGRPFRSRVHRPWAEALRGHNGSPSNCPPNLPLRGHKLSPYEGGSCVPVISPPRRQNDALNSHDCSEIGFARWLPECPPMQQPGPRSRGRNSSIALASPVSMETLPALHPRRNHTIASQSDAESWRRAFGSRPGSRHN